MSETSSTSTSIRRSSRARQRVTPAQQRRNKIIQISLGVLVLVLVFVLAAIAQGTNARGAFLVLIGVGLGYALQRSRFCFTAAFRDPTLTGGTNLTKAVIIALAVSSFLYMGLNMARFGLALDSLDLTKVAGHVQPVGLHTVIGAFLFGIGAVLAGGCASGTLMRMGEGFVQLWVAFVFFVIGSVLGVVAMVPIRTSPLLYSGRKVFLPEALGGWIPALILQFGLFLALYIAADLWARKKSGAL
jgi:uncharacterized protein